MNKQIGIYGGSFDPIHFGHLNLAVEIMEAHHLDEVWFCPSSMNPHKRKGSVANADDRIEMIRLAIDGEPRFRLLDCELRRPGPSYTIETLRELLNLQKDKAVPASFALILGQDAARNFFNWHCPGEIIKCARLLVGKRNDSYGNENFQGSSAIVKAIKKGLTPTHLMEISSTEIRARLAKGLYCNHLVPGKVLDYILSHHLY